MVEVLEAVEASSFKEAPTKEACFRITIASGRKYYLQAADVGERDRWLAAVKEQMKKFAHLKGDGHRISNTEDEPEDDIDELLEHARSGSQYDTLTSQGSVGPGKKGAVVSAASASTVSDSTYAETSTLLKTLCDTLLQAGISLGDKSISPTLNTALSSAAISPTSSSSVSVSSHVSTPAAVNSRLQTLVQQTNDFRTLVQEIEVKARLLANPPAPPAATAASAPKRSNADSVDSLRAKISVLEQELATARANLLAKDQKLEDFNTNIKERLVAFNENLKVLKGEKKQLEIQLADVTTKWKAAEQGNKPQADDSVKKSKHKSLSPTRPPPLPQQQQPQPP